jgi:hypothetical protein
MYGTTLISDLNLRPRPPRMLLEREEGMVSFPD